MKMLPIRWLLAVSFVGACSAPSEPTQGDEEAVDPLTVRGTGVGNTIKLEGQCRRRQANRDWEAPQASSIRLKVMQGAGQVLARFPTHDFGDVDVELAPSGRGAKSTERYSDPIQIPTLSPPAQLFYPRHDIRIEVVLGGGSLAVEVTRTDETWAEQPGYRTFITECAYEAPTTMWLDPNDSPQADPALRFPEGKLKKDGMCLTLDAGRLRVTPCTKAPRWAISKDDQLSSRGKCVRTGNFAGGATYPYLGDCPGDRVAFVVSKIAVGKRCLPTTDQSSNWMGSPIGNKTRECTTTDQGVGRWEFRENGTIYSKLGRDCLMRQGAKAKVTDCGASPTRWDILPEGRIRQRGTQDCVYEAADRTLAMASCSSSLPPWRLKGQLQWMRTSRTEYFDVASNGVVEENTVPREWELNF